MTTFNNEQERYDARLKKWEDFLGLPATEPQRTEVDFILNIKMSEIKQIPTMQLSEYAFMLMQYALFLQQQSNRCTTFLEWIKNVLPKLRGDCVVKATSFKREIEMRYARVAYLARRIETVAQAINNICRVRYSEGKTHESD